MEASVQGPGTVDKALLFNSTYIRIGDGRNTSFWNSRWLMESTPKDFAPKLYKRTRFKNRPVHKELTNANCIRSLGDIDTPELVTLHLAISSVTLSENNDQIS
jgi:hypothetical protein